MISEKTMMAGAVLVAVVVGAGYVGLSLWANSMPKGETIRLRATATILVDGVERTGSSVQEFQLQWVYQPQIGRTGAWRIASRGEATKVDVPGEEPIYVLMSLSSSNGNYGVLVETQCTVRDEGPEAQKASFTNIDSCSFDHFPKAIRFDGSGDYDTAIAVFAGGESRNGYRFTSMTMVRTDAPLTEGTMPMQIWAGDRKTVRAPYDQRISVIGEYSFKADHFR